MEIHWIESLDLHPSPAKGIDLIMVLIEQSGVEPSEPMDLHSSFGFVGSFDVDC